MEIQNCFFSIFKNKTKQNKKKKKKTEEHVMCICGCRLICCQVIELRAISPFPTVFSTGLYRRHVKTKFCLGNGSTVECILMRTTFARAAALPVTKQLMLDWYYQKVLLFQISFFFFL